LCDMYTTQAFLRGVGVKTEFLLKYPLPVIGIDTWSSDEADNVVDTFSETRKSGRRGLAAKIRRLLPVPLVRIGDAPGVCSFMPAAAPPLSKRSRAALRQSMGIAPGQRLVLFCTAKWQHVHYESAAGRRLAASVPALLASYLAKVPDAVLVHVG